MVYSVQIIQKQAHIVFDAYSCRGQWPCTIVCLSIQKHSYINSYYTKLYCYLYLLDIVLFIIDKQTCYLFLQKDVHIANDS